MPAIRGEHAPGVGLFGRLAGDAQRVFDGHLPALLVHYLAFDHKGLADMREIEIGIQCRATPDTSGFNPTVIGRADVRMVRRRAIPEEQRDGFLQLWLIAFDRKMVMCLASDQIVCALALCQQGIGGDSLACNLDRIKHSGKHADFIGLFVFVFVFYWSQEIELMLSLFTR